MIYLDRVANEIKHVGFYNMLYDDIKKFLQKENPTLQEIKEALEKKPEFLQEYKQLNVEYNISNIHLKNIDIKKVESSCKEKAKKINKNLDILRSIEKYTLEFEKSSFLVILFSVEFFVLFSVQYFIVLLSLKEYQWYIYGFFALSIVLAWYFAKKEKAKYERENRRFEKIYSETKKLLSELEKEGCINKNELVITECEDHI